MDASPVSSRRSEVLQVLRGSTGPLSIHEIAQRVGVHPNTVRFHLDTLVENGQAERVESERRSTGRPPLLFRATSGMDPTGPRRYRLLAEVLVQGLGDDPDSGPRAAEFGRAWGRRRAVASAAGAAEEPVARLTGLLDELGFAPEPRPGEQAPLIALRHCPFLELARTGTGIVCPVHLGLMQGALEAWHAPMTVERLEPFVEPDACLAHLTGPDSRLGAIPPRPSA